MNNPFENFNDWDEDIPEGESFNLYTNYTVPTINNNALPRLATSDWQIAQIGYHLGKHYTAETIMRKQFYYRNKIEINTDRAEDMWAQGRDADADYFADAAKDAQAKYTKWRQIAKRRREEKRTGVTQMIL